MRLLSKQSADGVSDEHRVDGGEYQFVVQGDLGGGTVSLEYKMDYIFDYIEMSEATKTAEGSSVLKLAPGHVRAELSGSTSPNVTAAISRVEALVEPEPDYIDLLLNGTLASLLTVSRTGVATVRNSTGAWEEVAANETRLHHNPNGEYLGLLSEGTRKNYLTDSSNPAAQTVNLSSTGSFTLWMEGTGSVTVRENTAIGSGFGAAMEGSPLSFTISDVGTVDVSIEGVVDRFQLERRAHPSTYIPTPADGTATRGVELIYSTDLTDIYDESGTTFLVRAYAPPADSINPYLFSVDDGETWQTSQETLGIRINSEGDVAAHVTVGGVEEASLALGRVPQGEYFSVAMRVSSGSISASLNGDAVLTASNVSMPSVSRFNVGSASETNHWFNPIRLVRVYKGALSNSKMRSLSETTEQVPMLDPSSTETLSLVLGPDPSSPTDNQPSKPGKGDTYVDPHYGVNGLKYRRASNANADISVNYGMKAYYPRRNPFNADGSMALVETMLSDGSDVDLHIINPNTGELIYSPFYTGPNTDVSYHRLENVWHYTDPNLMFALAADPEEASPPESDKFKLNVLDLTNVTNDGVPERTVFIDLTNVNFSVEGHENSTSITDVWSTAHRIWAVREGTPSKTVVAAGKQWAGFPRYWGFQVDDSGSYASYSSGLGAITYDLETNTITGILDYASINRTGADHVDMSPNGDYIAIAWEAENECDADTGVPCGLMIYNRDFSEGFNVHRTGMHADFALDAEGNDAYVWMDFDTADIKYTVCNTRTTHVLLDLDFSVDAGIYISGNCFNKPGYVLWSAQADDPTATPRADQWYHDKMMIVELVPTNARTWVIGHMYHGYLGDDEGDSHPTVNYDFTRVAWGSNWSPRSAGNVDDMDVYVMEIDGELP